MYEQNMDERNHVGFVYFMCLFSLGLKCCVTIGFLHVIAYILLCPMKIHNLEILPMCDFIQYFDHHFFLCGPREKK